VRGKYLRNLGLQKKLSEVLQIRNGAHDVTSYVHVPTISQLHLRSLTEDGGSLRIPQLLRSLNIFDATLVGNEHI
jgi:hypothetical protein